MNLFFFLFSAIIVLSAIAVISSRNPVHSVLFLILAFVNAAGIFVLAGAEFLAMILLIVYVGAVAVLFLFVVMMLNINLEEIKFQVKKYFFSGLFVGLILLAELFFSFSNLDLIRNKNVMVTNSKNLTNTHQIGSIIYTEYFFVFQLSGCILLVAMIGAIVLTLRKRPGVLRQTVSKQIDRKKEDSIEIIKFKNNNAN
ncbi:MAG: NADH:ubiquinone oxidoreductase subunit J [Pelagibacterales bacterium]|nr:NADH:ubiquinone oxidoreductase subunit J [Pelagibacterales bacterium]OUU63548.1 MAG: NADH:ubiquinone oxidoreductase subunit J [Alphaproteobacteria bacterium TMED62]|tara:strand:- start:11326 stop:11919 length:594 start_codon:yes stop_codon:yes gene_type:complete